jgi:hypothetical protein
MMVRRGIAALLVSMSLWLAIVVDSVVSARPSTTTAPTTTTIAAESRPCSKTLLPDVSVKNAYNAPGREPGAHHIEYPSQLSPMVDGDGNAISYVTNPDGTNDVQITRPDGVVTLTGPAKYLGMTVGTWNIGDLNGDGHSDYIVEEFNTTPSTDNTYVISGTVPPGVHDIGSVSIRIPETATPPGQLNFAQSLRPIGDQNNNGTADIAVGHRLYDGRALLAGRPGRTLKVSPRPYGTIDHLVTSLRLDSVRPPTLVQVLGYIDPGHDVTDHVQLRLLGPNVMCLNTAEGPISSLPCTPQQQAQYPCADFPRDYQVVGWQRPDGHRIVELSQGTRGGTTAYQWDLDA